MKGKGILLPVFSLPSKYGIGCFSKEAYEFVDLLADTNQVFWQVLPLSPTSLGDSPYQSPSSFAGNPYFIDLEKLKDDGLLTEVELETCVFNGDSIDYGWLYNTRNEILRKCFDRFIENMPENYFEFCKNNANWLDDYALFMVLKDRNDGAIFNSWSNPDIKSVKQNINFYINDMAYYKFLQYEFYTQWYALKSYANSKGISIIGDIPIYVALDSADVFAHPELFELDDNFIPKVVAGVPPDAFSSDGQLWGNPVYNWESHESQDYKWWLDRIGHCLTMYDYVRIDHFRGFAAYYTIDNGETTAKNGRWVKGKGKQLFTKVKEKFEDAKILAEDLGLLDDDVRDLLSFTGYPGMKVLQFGLDDNNSEYLPKNYTHNCIAYTGTHDNMPSRLFVSNLTNAQKRVFDKNIKRKKGELRIIAFIRAILESKANIKIIPMFDYLLSKTDRINTPSTNQGNWQVRLKPKYINKTLINRIKNI